MSTASRLSVLALASTVLASPFAGNGHAHAHRHLHSGSVAHSGSAAPYSYKSSNSTMYGTTGTGYAAPTGSPSYLTSTVTGKSTMYTTLYVTVSGSSGSGAEVGPAGVSTDCSSDVTVTNTAKVTVTVTAGDSSSSVASPVQSSSSASAPAYSAPAYSAPSSGSSEAAPVSTSSSSSSTPAYTAPAYTAPAYTETPSSVSTSVAAAVTPSSSAAPTSTAPAYTPSTESSSSSSVVAILPTSYSLVADSSESTATSSAPASYTSAASSGGKRGLAYNSTTVDLVSCFTDSTQVSWAYDWVSSALGMEGFNFIPTLHSSETVFTATWAADAAAAIASGSTTLFSFNEPDISSQANMDVAAAVTAWNTYMEPLAGKAKLCAPSVSNSDIPNQGLDYLQQFLDQCTGCTIDCFSIHWYGTDVDNLKNQTNAAVSMAGGKPVWVSEFALTGTPDEGIGGFLEEIMPWFDSNDDVAGYAYFMVADGMLASGTEPSTYGTTYMSYTS